MPYDNLLRLSGPAAGNSVEASAITADADLTGGWRYVGKYRQGYADCRIAGAFDRTTGDEVLAFEVYEGTDSSGTGSALIASSANLTATNAANLTGSTANGKAAGTLSDGPTRVGFTTGSGGWIKGRANVGGTTPSAASVSMNVVMTAGATQTSGV